MNQEEVNKIILEAKEKGLGVFATLDGVLISGYNHVAPYKNVEYWGPDKMPTITYQEDKAMVHLLHNAGFLSLDSISLTLEPDTGTTVKEIVTNIYRGIDVIDYLLDNVKIDVGPDWTSLHAAYRLEEQGSNSREKVKRTILTLTPSEYAGSQVNLDSDWDDFIGGHPAMIKERLTLDIARLMVEFAPYYKGMSPEKIASYSDTAEIPQREG